MMQIMECSKVFVVAFIGLILMTAGFCLTLAACFAPPINDAVKGVRIAGPVILGIGTVVLGTSCLMCSVVQEKCCSHYLEYWKKRRSVMSFFRGDLSRGGPDGMTDTIPVTANDVGSPTGTGESAFINYNDINRPPPQHPRPHPHQQHVCGTHGAKCEAAAAAAASSAVITGAPQCMPPSVCPPPYNHQRACYDSPRYDHRASSYSHNIDFSTATEDDDDDDLDDELDFDSLEVSSGGTPIGSPVRAPVRQYSSIPSVRVKSLASRKLLGALDDHETRRLLDSANASNSSTPFSSPQREPRGMPPPPSPSPAPASTSTAADRDECLAVYPHDPPPPPGLITRGVGQYIILPRGDINSPAASPHKTPPERARTSHHGNRGKSQSPLLPRRTTEHPSYRGSTVKIGHSVV